LLLLAVISINVLLKLPGPEICSGLWISGISAPRMPMPETAMHEYDRSVPWQDDVR
jgi:hypothetical protein